MAETNKDVIIVDTGSGETKCGLGGEQEPSCVLPTILGKPRYAHILAGIEEKQCYVGDMAQLKRGVLSLKHPVEHGVITDWEDIEKLWTYLFSQKMNSDPTDSFIFQVEPPLNPKSQREKLVETMFETFAAKGTYIGISAVMSLYSAGSTTGLVVDSGDGVTHVVPVYEGYALSHCITRLNLGGRDITDYLERLLTEQGYFITTTSERQTVRDIKEKLGYVALDFDAELEKARQTDELRERYVLPDGQMVFLNNERFRCAEILFRPSLIGMEQSGLPAMVTSVVGQCDVDLRRHLFENIVFSGGNSLFPGIDERLKKDMTALVPPEVKVETVKQKNRLFSAWIGASILTSIASFQEMWITKSEYDENGPKIVHRKCF